MCVKPGMTKLSLPNKELQPIILWFELSSGRSRAPAYVRCARGESVFVLPNEHSGTIWKRQKQVMGRNVVAGAKPVIVRAVDEKET